MCFKRTIPGLLGAGLLTALACSSGEKDNSGLGHPSILFIATDDMNDWIGGGHGNSRWKRSRILRSWETI
jgi:hypothetical protein